MEHLSTIVIIYFQGYSSLAIALVLPETGYLVACERDDKSLEVAERYYKQAGVSHKVIHSYSICKSRIRKFFIFPVQQTDSVV